MSNIAADSDTCTFSPGDVVETTYGVGVIVARPPVNDDADVDPSLSLFYRVLLWRVPGKSIGSSSSASLRLDNLIRKLPAAPGMITTKQKEKKTTRVTTVGGINENDESHQQKFMVQAYYANQEVYRIIPINSRNGTTNNQDGSSDHVANSNASIGDQVISTTRRLSRVSIVPTLDNGDESSTIASPEEVPINALSEVALAAKFYPLLVQLIRRADRAALATHNFIDESYNSEGMKHLQKQVSDVAKQATPYLREQKEKISIGLDKVKSTATSTATTDPQVHAQNVKDVVSDSGDKIALKLKETAETPESQQLLEMLKTEDLNVLLEKGKERLEQLLHDDIPMKTKTALEHAGIRIVDDDDDDDENIEDDKNENKKNKKMCKKAMIKSQRAALAAMNTILEQSKVNPDDIDAIRKSINENFGSLLDRWQEAAKSDRNLSGLLDTVNEQTVVWQEATGRLLNTRSAGIFLDGASRIQERAKNLFAKDQLQWAGEVGLKLTKAFSEGDAAVARLKSIELGDSVRDRLVAAIEIRSESLGGLDGIIAGALTAVNQNVAGVADKVAGDVKKRVDADSSEKMQSMLTDLQSRASSFKVDSNETLISVLGRQSKYRDVALLKVEQVMCDLDSQFGQDLSPEAIAAIAQGEGGTAKLFDPIAKRAAKEIENQLDVAESSVSDPTILEVLTHVRKIVSGELTVTAVLDEVVNILNDDKIVAVGENLVKHGEKVLDAIEGIDGNKVVDDAMKIAERAGITKSRVMKGIDNIDVNELLDNAGNAITDEKVRVKLLSDATDTALDFILKVLPSMPVPPVEGVKDGLVYRISNLSLEGFEVKKHNIIVEIAGMRATKKSEENSPVIEFIDDKSTLESSHASSAVGVESQVGISSNSSCGSEDMDYDTSINENITVNAAELLIIDVSEISAIMNDVEWSFEQTYLPYLKGNGKFDVKMRGGAIRLVFELRKREKTNLNNGEVKWEPVLCLHDRFCSIGSVEFNVQGGSRMAWVVNKVASVFKGLIRDYIVKVIVKILTEKSGWIRKFLGNFPGALFNCPLLFLGPVLSHIVLYYKVSKLNAGLSPFWDVLLRTAKLELGDLDVASQKDIVEASLEPTNGLLELVWRERLPLGMNLLLNDDGGKLKVVDFPRGSQARTVCEDRNLDPEDFKGSTVVAVNGIRYHTEDDLFEALRDPGRPKTIQFELAESEDAERIRRFVEESQAPEMNTTKTHRVSAIKRDISIRDVDFTDDMDLGIEFASALDNMGLVVRKFLESKDGLILAAERKNEKINPGDLLTHINGKLVVGESGSVKIKALKILEAEGMQRPLRLTFADPYLCSIVYEQSESLPYNIGGPAEEILLEEDKDTKRILLDGFEDVDGVSEKAGVLLGDYLVFINGQPVGAGCRWMGERSTPSLTQVEDMLQDKSKYPIGLTFARPQRQGEERSRDWTSTLLGSAPEEAISMETSETICVSADFYEQLGLVLELKVYSDIVVKDLHAIAGPFQASTQKLRDPQNSTYHHLSIDSINGEFVPSYATPNLVKNAMERSWKSEKSVDVTYCDIDKKMYLLSLKDK